MTAPFRLLDVRCHCNWWLSGVWVRWNPFTDSILKVRGKCKRHGWVDAESWVVWP